MTTKRPTERAIEEWQRIVLAEANKRGLSVQVMRTSAATADFACQTVLHDDPPAAPAALTIDGWMVTHGNGELPTMSWAGESGAVYLEMYRGPDHEIGQAYADMHNCGGEDKIMRKARVTIELLPNQMDIGLSLPAMDDADADDEAEPVSLHDAKWGECSQTPVPGGGKLYALRNVDTGRFLCGTTDHSPPLQEICTYIHPDHAATSRNGDDQFEIVELSIGAPIEQAVPVMAAG